MKKKFLWISILFTFLLFTACDAKLEKTEPTQFRVVCFGCKEQFSRGQLNADFGLCQDCMLRVGAAYCQDCETPCYTRDMVRGRCQTCSAAVEGASAEAVDTVSCKLCGKTITSSQSQGGYCSSCYAQSQYQEEEQSKARCSHCGVAYGDADPLVRGICQDCWSRGYGPVGVCKKCGKSYTDGEGFESICYSCDEKYGPKCKVCGISLTFHGGEDGMCYYCYEASQKCIRCGTDSNEYDGYCYYCHPSFGFYCKICGYAYPAHRPEDEICPSCKCDECGAILAAGDEDGLCDDCDETPEMCPSCNGHTVYKDGLCYYCHPDFGFTCIKCGYGYPAHRPESGMCPDCEGKD